jgi:hypothetical protein
MSLEMCPCRVARACVVILSASARRFLLEGGRLSGSAMFSSTQHTRCDMTTQCLPGRWAQNWHCTGRCSPGTPAPSSRHTFCHCGVCSAPARAGGRGRPDRVREAPCLWSLLRPWCARWAGFRSWREVWRLRAWSSRRGEGSLASSSRSN